MFSLPYISLHCILAELFFSDLFLPQIPNLSICFLLPSKLPTYPPPPPPSPGGRLAACDFPLHTPFLARPPRIEAVIVNGQRLGQGGHFPSPPWTLHLSPSLTTLYPPTFPLNQMKKVDKKKKNSTFLHHPLLPPSLVHHFTKQRDGRRIAIGESSVCESAWRNGRV